MNFGMVTYEGLTEKDFVSPVIDQKVLPGEKAVSPAIHIGLPKWGRVEWVGKIYPLKTKAKDFLEHYVQHFNSIELNATHYKIYNEGGIEKWASQVNGRDFLFCPKMFQGVTHRGSLTGKDSIVTEFLNGILAFKKHLGAVFIQLDDHFSPSKQNELFSFLESLPTDIEFFLELRNPGWFTKKEIRDDLFNFLISHRIGAVITDTPELREIIHMQLTIPKAFIRFVCQGDKPLDYTRIDNWKNQLKQWYDNGLKDCYFFLHTHNEDSTIDFAKDVQQEFSGFF